MKWMMIILWRGLFLVVLGYLSVCLYVFLRQRAMLYHPREVSEEEMLREADSVGLVRWRDPRGTPLGWMTPGGTETLPVLIFHGNAGTALDRTALIERLRSAGVRSRIYLADYPGYGSAPGRPSQKALVDAALRALDALPGPAIVAGESLGTGVAAQAAENRAEKIRGLILITPFDSMVSAAAHHYPWLPVSLLLRDRFDSIRALQHFPNPVAILLAENDATTPHPEPDGFLTAFPVRKKFGKRRTPITTMPSSPFPTGNGRISGSLPRNRNILFGKHF